MIRSTTARTRPVRIGAAIVGVAGAMALTGCATSAADDTTEGAVSAPASSADAGTSDAGASAGSYADGTYSAEGSYATPDSVETVSVTVTLADDVITAVEVVGDPQKAESKQFQSKFIGGISEVVVGRDIDDISVSRVAGSSLTSGGFNRAIEEIKTEAVV